MSAEPPPSPVVPEGERPPSAAGSAIRTFLIADVRGYTRFTQEHGDEEAAKLAARFATVARQGVEERGGVVIELRGDEALAVFGSARQAIRAALHLQELFLEASVSDPSLPLLVGIGLDAGEAVEVESGYRGGALNLAARLCAIAAPGEVLASREVTHLARKTEGVRFEDRGHVALKGLAEPVVVIRVVSEESDAAARLAGMAANPRSGSAAHRPLQGRRRWVLTTVAAVGAIGVVGAGLLAFTRLTSGGTHGSPTPPVGAGQTTICQLAAGHLNDNSFNQATYDGLTRAATDLGVTVRATQVPDDAAQPHALQQMVSEHCDLIVVTRDAQDAMIVSAQANPRQKYALLDPFEAPQLPNVVGLAFKIDQSAFLAGYLAAGSTRTGKVATFGAVPIPTVVPFMDGFAAGVLKFDADHHARVKLIGWDPVSSNGTFISQSDISAFNNTSAAQAIARAQIAQGADVMFPVAGPVDGDAAMEVARQKVNVLGIGVDVDAFYQSPQFADLWLTSVRKRFDVAVRDVVGEVVSGTFKGGALYEGTLMDGGVDLAPFHELDGRVPAKLKAELATLESQVESGAVSVDPRTYAPN